MEAGAGQSILRPGLLDGQVLAVAATAAGLGRAVAAACGALGADVEQLGNEGHRVDLLDEPAVGEAIAAIAAPERRLDTVVVDAASAFAGAPAGSQPLSAAVTGCWVVARACATRVMIDAEEGGKLVLLAPGSQAGPQAGAARAALENMARTLSIEWSRYAIRTTAILPGRSTAPGEVAELVAYLASPAGDYFSGCVLALGTLG